MAVLALLGLLLLVSSSSYGLSNPATIAESFALPNPTVKVERIREAAETQLSPSRRTFLAAAAVSGTALLWPHEYANALEYNSSSLTVAQSPASSSSLPSSSGTVKWQGIVQKAATKALGGGKAGAAAAVVQVCSLMWLRTTMNYQYRYGGSLPEALQTLWNQGGVARLYQGLPFALIQGPATRFGDTAANIGIMALFDALPVTHNLPLPIITACGSAVAGLWRIVLMPIDASKTAMQVEGGAGLKQLWERATNKGPGPLYRGAFAQAAATAVGHFPWFVTYNWLNEQLPTVPSDEPLLALVRSAFLGLSASCVSDCCSNSLRVVKTTKQTVQLTLKEGEKEPSYPEIVSMIIDKDGVVGLFGRGLQTRLLTNAIQGALFSVLWKYFQQIGSSQ